MSHLHALLCLLLLLQPLAAVINEERDEPDGGRQRDAADNDAGDGAPGERRLSVQRPLSDPYRIWAVRIYAKDSGRGGSTNADCFWGLDVQIYGTDERRPQEVV